MDPSLVAVTSGVEKAEDFLALESMLQQPHPPTAIVCMNDSRAMHVLDYCGKHRIAVPGTLAVTGFDNSAESAFTRPPLTTVDKNDALIGRTVLDLLHKQQTGKLKGIQNILIEPQLVIRESG